MDPKMMADNIIVNLFFKTKYHKNASAPSNAIIFYFSCVFFAIAFGINFYSTYPEYIKQTKKTIIKRTLSLS